MYTLDVVQYARIWGLYACMIVICRSFADAYMKLKYRTVLLRVICKSLLLKCRSLLLKCGSLVPNYRSG